MEMQAAKGRGRQKDREIILQLMNPTLYQDKVWPSGVVK